MTDDWEKDSAINSAECYKLAIDQLRVRHVMKEHGPQGHVQFDGKPIFREDDELDEKQFAAWVKQASKLPGERMLAYRVETESKLQWCWTAAFRCPVRLFRRRYEERDQHS